MHGAERQQAEEEHRKPEHHSVALRRIAAAVQRNTASCIKTALRPPGGGRS